jgi:hypothetical protein
MSVEQGWGSGLGETATTEEEDRQRHLAKAAWALFPRASAITTEDLDRYDGFTEEEEE